MFFPPNLKRTSLAQKLFFSSDDIEPFFNIREKFEAGKEKMINRKTLSAGCRAKVAGEKVLTISGLSQAGCELAQNRKTDKIKPYSSLWHATK